MPAVLQGLLLEADDAVLRHDYEEALRILERIDPLLRRARLDGSPLRAKWWLRRGNALETDPQRWEERVAALTAAAQLFERVDPGDRDYGVALGNIAAAHWEHSAEGGEARARDWFVRAVAAQQTARNRDDGELLTLYANLGHVHSHFRDWTSADAAFAEAVALAGRTYGEDNRRYWHVAAAWADAIHTRGDIAPGIARFEELMARLPAEPALEDQDTVAMAYTQFGAALVREGRPHLAVPLLEKAERGYQRAHRGYRLAFLHRTLGDAYEGAGRLDDARRQFQLSLEALRSEQAEDSAAVLAGRERWARFLLASGESAAAERELEDVLALAEGRHASLTALAQAGFARLALARGDRTTAVRRSREALDSLEGAAPDETGHVAQSLWVTHARALAAAGDVQAAEPWARRALDTRRRHSHPASAELAELEALVQTLEAR